MANKHRVFTPPHISTFIFDLLGRPKNLKILDPACGELALLRPFAFDNDCTGLDVILPPQGGKIKTECVDFLNMPVSPQYDMVVLNPPYESPRIICDFVSRALDCALPGGTLAIIVPINFLIGKSYTKTRHILALNYHVQTIAILNPRLFFPVSAATCLIIIKKGPPGPTKFFNAAQDGRVLKKGLMLKGGVNNLPDILAGVTPPKFSVLGSTPWAQIDGSPPDAQLDQLAVIKSIYAALVNYPQLGITLAGPSNDAGVAQLSNIFHIYLGSASTDNSSTHLPLITSTMYFNGISGIGLGRSFPPGCISVSAFCDVFFHPWAIAAAGGGGGAPRILTPKIPLGFYQGLWIATQLSAYKHGFSFGRMITKKFLMGLQIDLTVPPEFIFKVDNYVNSVILRSKINFKNR